MELHRTPAVNNNFLGTEVFQFSHPFLNFTHREQTGCVDVDMVVFILFPAVKQDKVLI